MSKFSSKGPSSAELAAQQEAAAAKERERIELETAEQDAQQEADLQAAYAEKSAQRQDFANADALTDDDTQRRKFLKGA